MTSHQTQLKLAGLKDLEPSLDIFTVTLYSLTIKDNKPDSTPRL